jgi:hypothetical protein
MSVVVAAEPVSRSTAARRRLQQLHAGVWPAVSSVALTQLPAVGVAQLLSHAAWMF